jgi:galactokinase/mevalonate kinase-like predicted kinase
MPRIRMRAAPQVLLSLPPAMAGRFARVTGLRPPEWVAACDPAGAKLGSGGGVARMLQEGWRSTAAGMSFGDWLGGAQKLVWLAGGSSRRLPAYAACGKVLLPMPVLRWSVGQRLDQTLLDLQAPLLLQILAEAPESARVLVASGDVFLHLEGPLPTLPDADIVGIGMWVRPEVARDFGVFFCPHGEPGCLDFFLQKPSPEEIRAFSETHLFLVDTGLWLLSAKAVGVLMAKCGARAGTAEFAGDVPGWCELYSGIGPGLGKHPNRPDPDLAGLTSAVAALPGARFLHLGTNRQLIGAVSELQNLQLDQTKLGGLSAQPHPDQHITNARFEPGRNRSETPLLWIENATVPASWELRGGHVITNVPANDWRLSLPKGACLDCVPVEGGIALRTYHIDDPFKGPIGDPTTQWHGIPAAAWLATRTIALERAGIDPRCDVHDAPIFPVVPPGAIDAGFVQWLFEAGSDLEASARHRAFWLAQPRWSAAQLGERADLDKVDALRDGHLRESVALLASRWRSSPFLRLDLGGTARLCADAPPELPGIETAPPLARVHALMFEAASIRLRGEPPERWGASESEAFSVLRNAILEDGLRRPANPRCRLQEDQIVWGRSPVRLDLAGGWSDTPPYCFEHGGKVVNLAVDLNGQPPIQVFARIGDRPEITIRSIDLGVEERVRTFDELAGYADPSSGFALAKAALALAGFLPRFRADGGAATLEDQLRAFGGGIEISLLCAVPKGSGLGTSSILAATLLGTLSDLCDLGWDHAELVRRTLALEQMLTTGGGWQDQAGGIYRGVKLIETAPGLDQTPTLRWLPEHLFDAGNANRRILLYYTGITRLAKGILQEIVRGMFLNSGAHLSLLGELSGHAEATYRAVQTGDWEALCAAVRRSWEINRRLDPGTNPASVQSILDRVAPHIAAAKLLGAGGGGYLLLLARDEGAAARLRAELETHPPNAKARFVNFEVSHTGLQVTRS